MPNIEIVRLESDQHYGTFGVLKVNKAVFCVTLEPPNFGNMQNLSCIPCGQYQCTRFHGSKYPDTFEIRHVPNRAAILFHAGNVVADTEGCILLAQHFGKLRGDRAVLNSGATFKSFLYTVRDEDGFVLTITEHY